MQLSIPTDEQLRAADADTRARYMRVYTLMHTTGCDFQTAAAAIADADTTQAEIASIRARIRALAAKAGVSLPDSH